MMQVGQAKNYNKSSSNNNRIGFFVRIVLKEKHIHMHNYYNEKSTTMYSDVNEEIFGNAN